MPIIYKLRRLHKCSCNFHLTMHTVHKVANYKKISLILDRKYMNACRNRKHIANYFLQIHKITSLIINKY